jgi:hypothetical protein
VEFQSHDVRQLDILYARKFVLWKSNIFSVSFKMSKFCVKKGCLLGISLYLLHKLQEISFAL